MDHTEQIVEHLHNALDAILASLTELGPLPHEPPDEALDAALRADERHQAARAEFRQAWDVLMVHLPDNQARKSALDLEAASNALAASAFAGGWRCGLRCHLPE